MISRVQPLPIKRFGQVCAFYPGFGDAVNNEASLKGRAFTSTGSVALAIPTAKLQASLRIACAETPSPARTAFHQDCAVNCIPFAKFCTDSL